MPTIQRQPRIKFANARHEQQAQRLMELERKRAKLQEQLRAVEAEQRDALLVLGSKYPDGFHFADKRGYEQEFEFCGYDRRILDQAAAKRILERMGKKVPMVVSHVSQFRINPVYEDQE